MLKVGLGALGALVLLCAALVVCAVVLNSKYLDPPDEDD